MGHSDPTYVIFDGDEDKWAYAYMKGWNANERMNFDFRDAHHLDSMTSRAQGEQYVKRHLRERMNHSSAVVVLIGEKTRNLYRFVRWEIELALDIGVPIIGVNLNNLRQCDDERCPPILRGECVVYVPFKMRAIQYALDNWPTELRRLPSYERSGGSRYYNDAIYKGLGL